MNRYHVGAIAVQALLVTFLITSAAQAVTETQKLIASDAAAGDQFGRSIAVSGDTAIIGAWSKNDVGYGSGVAYVFTRIGTEWRQQQKLVANDTASEDYFGISVSVFGDTAVVGAAGDGDAGIESGSAYVFTRSDSVWTQQQKLTASDSAAGDFFGVSNSVSEDTVIVGAHSTNSVVGSAYVFTRSNGVWTQQQELTVDESATDFYFGISVSLAGDTALVGAPTSNHENNRFGSAYVFTRSAGLWTQQQKLTASDPAHNDLFGFAVSISGETALIGARGDSENSDESGAAYIFTRSAGVWSELQKLTASDAAMKGHFGYSVCISDNSAVIGAPSDDDAGAYSGSAYVFTRSVGGWIREQKLTASDGEAENYFGSSVSLSGELVMVGALREDEAGVDSGSAYVYRIDAAPPHTADQNANHIIDLAELLRVIQLYKVGAYACFVAEEEGEGAFPTEDGFILGAGDQSCTPHDSDFMDQDWTIAMSELLRLVQLYNLDGYAACGELVEDGYCAN